jgi:hypothetical protein
VWSIGTYEVDPNKLVAEITHVEGSDLTIVNQERGRDITYAPKMDQITIYEGASIITGEDTFVEIVLKNSRAVIKIAENTNFRLQHVETEPGESLFHVFAGSIRAKIKRLTSNSQYYFVGGNTVSGVRGTDFGMTIGRPGTDGGETKVYCFEGELEVVPREYIGPELPEPKERTIVATGEMVKVPPEDAPSVLPKTAISDDIKAYWRAHPFKTKLPGETGLDSGKAGKNTPWLIAGGTTLALGIAAETYGIVRLATLSPGQSSDAFTTQQTRGTAAVITGGGLLAASAVTLFIGLIVSD